MLRSASACPRGSFTAFKPPNQSKLEHPCNITPEIKKGYGSAESTPDQQREVSEFQIVPSLGEGLLKATQNFKVEGNYNTANARPSTRASGTSLAGRFNGHRR